MKRTLDSANYGHPDRTVVNFESNASNSETTIVSNRNTVTILGFGVKGDTGPPGARGENGDKEYMHTQAIPSDIWTIAHGLDKFPSVTVVDSSGELVDGSVKYIDKNNVVLEFSGGFSGQANLN